MSDFGKQITGHSMGGPQEPSRVLEAFPEANCAARNPLTGWVPVSHGAKGRPTLDVQEGNPE